MLSRMSSRTLLISSCALIALFVPAACSDGPSATVDDVEPESSDTAAIEEESEQDQDPLGRFRGLVSPAEFEHFEENRGLVTNESGATPGLTVVMPLNSTDIHLLDEASAVIHSWSTDYAPGGWCYLADDGTLYRGARQDEDPKFKGGGIGGVIQRLAPDGEEIWRFDFANEEHCQHHDIEVLPNGNVLFIAWERKSAEEAIALGRDPRGVGTVGLWADAVFEVRPTLPVGGEIVWSWHSWDHLVQDRDSEKPDYSSLSDRPERIDVNADFVPPSTLTEEDRRAAAERKRQMAALGYGGGDEEEEEEEDSGPDPEAWNRSGDWLHTNAIDWSEELDLIVLSSPELGEIFVIDHSTTTEESAGSTGGRRGRGGDILWRWGNPVRYGLGGQAEQRLFYQHDPQWLPVGSGERPRLLVFNNGGERHDGSSFSEVLELELPFDAESGFIRTDDAAWGPADPVWSYSDPETFFSAFISGAERLSSGNTLVCSGVVGRIFEVEPSGEIVWDYYNELGGDVDPPDHAGNAPRYSLYRAARYSREHPGVKVLLD